MNDSSEAQEQQQGPDDDDAPSLALSPFSASTGSVEILEDQQEDLLLRHRRHRRTSSPPDPQEVNDGDSDDEDGDPGHHWFGSWCRCSPFRPKSSSPAFSASEFFKRQSDLYWQGNGLQNYSAAPFRKDCLAGFTVAVMAVPLSMSYAKLAGLPAYYGIYATFVPPLVYPLFGTSRQLAVGAAALVSLVVNTGVTTILRDEGWTAEDIAANNDEYLARYTSLAIQCSFLAGLINLGMGFFRLGFVTQFLSRALISGFTSGAAVVIAVSQIKYLLGYTIPSSNQVQKLIRSLVQNIDQFNWRTFVFGSACFCALMGFKYASHKYPTYSWIKALGPFSVSVLSIVLMVTALDDAGDKIPLVGNIPKGLPSVTINQWTPVNSKLLVSLFLCSREGRHAPTAVRSGKADQIPS